MRTASHASAAHKDRRLLSLNRNAVKWRNRLDRREVIRLISR
jgi:hypothetical protein